MVAFTGSPSQYLSEGYPFGQATAAASPEKIPTQRAVEPEQEYKPHSSDFYTSEIEVKPPEHFEAVKITSKEEAPEPEVATVPTQKLFKDTNVFKDVDTHAVEVA